MIRFTSDLHFGHTNVIKYDGRPFESVEQMNAELIRRWNEKVQPNDTTYILGDFSWYGAERTAAIAQQLNGRKILIAGNHDRNFLPGASKAFDEIHRHGLEIKLNKRHVTLCHYPEIFYNHQHHEGYMLYGHVHNSYEYDLAQRFRHDLLIRGVASKMFNVGCMLWNYEPVSLEEIEAGVLNKNIERVEYHTTR